MALDRAVVYTYILMVPRRSVEFVQQLATQWEINQVFCVYTIHLTLLST